MKRGKRKAGGGQSSYARLGKARKVQAAGRAHYQTVARTRGVYGQGEMKYFDTERPTQALTASVDWAGTEHDPSTTQEATPVSNPNTLFAPIQGTAINQRIGRQAKIHKIKIKGHLQVVRQASATIADNGTLCRILLVQDMQTNSAQMQGEDLMADPTTNTAAAAVDCFQDLKNFGRFKVWKDKLMTIQNPNMGISTTTTTNVSQGLVKPFHFNLTFKEPIVVRFNAGVAGTVADIVDNSFHIIASCDDITLIPTISYISRVCFKE